MKQRQSQYYFIFALLLSLALSDSSIEYNITQTVMSSFDRNQMPANLSIRIEIILNQIVQIDEQSQILTTNSIMKMYWIDERLQFLPMGSVTEFLTTTKSMWIPDLFVINTANNGRLPLEPEDLVRVNYKGNHIITGHMLEFDYLLLIKFRWSYCCG